MNVSEFERNKPKKTYSKIKEIQDYVDSYIDLNRDKNEYNIQLYKLKTDLQELLSIFLRGE